MDQSHESHETMIAPVSKHHLFYTEPPEPLIRAAELLRLMSAWRYTTRELVLRYQSEILQRHQWRAAEQFAGTFQVPIRSPQMSYMLSEEHQAIYREQCEAARQAISLEGGDPASCPLAQAEQWLANAQSLVIQELSKVSGLAYLVTKRHSLSLQEQAHWIESALLWAEPFMRSQEQQWQKHQCQDVLGAEETDGLRSWCDFVDKFRDPIL